MSIIQNYNDLHQSIVDLLKQKVSHMNPTEVMTIDMSCWPSGITELPKHKNNIALKYLRNMLPTIEILIYSEIQYPDNTTALWLMFKHPKDEHSRMILSSSIDFTNEKSTITSMLSAIKIHDSLSTCCSIQQKHLLEYLNDSNK